MSKSKIIVVLLSVLLCLWLVGCGPKFDTSSDEAYNASLSEVSESLNKDLLPLLNSSLFLIQMTHPDTWQEQIHGKTAFGVIALGEEISKEMKDPNSKARKKHEAGIKKSFGLEELEE